MGHLAAILAVERSLVHGGVGPATAADAARSAWLAAWERGGCVDGAPGTRGRPLLLAARRLTVVGRGGAARATAPLACEIPEAVGADGPCAALDDLLDAAAEAARSPAHAVRAARRAGASLADVGAACGVSGEAARKWVTGAAEPGSRARGDLLAFLARLGA